MASLFPHVQEVVIAALFVQRGEWVGVTGDCLTYSFLGLGYLWDSYDAGIYYSLIISHKKKKRPLRFYIV